MFGLNLLRNAISRLAGSLNALADTADEIRVSVRQQLALDAAPVEVVALPSLPHGDAPDVANGESAGAADGRPSNSKKSQRRATAHVE